MKLKPCFRVRRRCPGNWWFRGFGPLFLYDPSLSLSFLPFCLLLSQFLGLLDLLSDPLLGCGICYLLRLALFDLLKLFLPPEFLFDFVGVLALLATD